jgi:hypothetical protein
LIKWVSTSRLTLAGTGEWQYVSGQIQAPAGAADCGGQAGNGLDCHAQQKPPQTLSAEIAQDNGYLAAIPGARQPTIMWEYWDWDTKTPGCQITSPAVKDEWRSVETQNGGS